MDFRVAYKAYMEGWAMSPPHFITMEESAAFAIGMKDRLDEFSKLRTMAEFKTLLTNFLKEN